MPLIHETALRRIEHGSQGYAPIIVPRYYKVVARRTGTHPEGSIRLQGDFQAIDRNPMARAALQTRLWNWVWLKRIFYFATVFVTAWIALMPFMYRTEPTDGNDPGYGNAFSAIPEFIGTFLPRFAAPWIDVWRANAIHFLILLILSATGLAIGGVLAGTIHDKAQHIWRGQAAQAGFSWKALDEAVFNLRTSRWYRALFLRLKMTLLPFFAVLFGLVGLALISHLMFAIKEGWHRLACRRLRGLISIKPAARPKFCSIPGRPVGDRAYRSRASAGTGSPLTPTIGRIVDSR